LLDICEEGRSLPEWSSSAAVRLARKYKVRHDKDKPFTLSDLFIGHTEKKVYDIDTSYQCYKTFFWIANGKVK
jgi:hypothetical protein